MLSLMDRYDPLVLIAFLFVPNRAELIKHAAEHGDPIGDHAYGPVEGLVHR